MFDYISILLVLFRNGLQSGHFYINHIVQNTIEMCSSQIIKVPSYMNNHVEIKLTNFTDEIKKSINLNHSEKN